MCLQGGQKDLSIASRKQKGWCQKNVSEKPSMLASGKAVGRGGEGPTSLGFSIYMDSGVLFLCQVCSQVSSDLVMTLSTCSSLILSKIKYFVCLISDIFVILSNLDQESDWLGFIQSYSFTLKQWIELVSHKPYGISMKNISHKKNRGTVIRKDGGSVTDRKNRHLNI